MESIDVNLIDFNIYVIVYKIYCLLVCVSFFILSDPIYQYATASQTLLLTIFLSFQFFKSSFILKTLPFNFSFFFIILSLLFKCTNSSPINEIALLTSSVLVHLYFDFDFTFWLNETLPLPVFLNYLNFAKVNTLFYFDPTYYHFLTQNVGY